MSSPTAGRGGIAVVDYGAKRSILRGWRVRAVSVTVFPHDVDAATLAVYDGVVLSNGPGDPEPLVEETATVSDLLGRVPLLGICLGHQLLALASGLDTFKLPFGHRGANHPVLERATGRVLVTSQNHGFAVEPGGGRAASYESLYDGTIEGLAHPEPQCPFGAVPSGGGTGPARRLADHDPIGRRSLEGARSDPCRGVTTSPRSA